MSDPNYSSYQNVCAGLNETNIKYFKQNMEII
jgi:hypothetical protein